MIAAIAQRHVLTILSRNLGHFEPLGVAVEDPFTDLWRHNLSDRKSPAVYGGNGPKPEGRRRGGRGEKRTCNDRIIELF